MIPEEAGLFEAKLLACIEVLSMPGKFVRPSDEAMEIWWEQLSPYPLARVIDALSKINGKGKFPPKPREVIDILVSGDGRPDEESAWARSITAHDETETVVMTQEMLHAWGVASPLMASGDKVGARMAFKKSYARAVELAREGMIAIKWSVSLGSDKQRQTDVLTNAVAIGQLEKGYVKSFQLPPPPTEENAALVGLLTGTVKTTSNDLFNKRINIMRDKIKRGFKSDEEREQKKRDFELASRKAEREQKNAILRYMAKKGVA